MFLMVMVVTFGRFVLVMVIIFISRRFVMVVIAEYFKECTQYIHRGLIVNYYVRALEGKWHHNMMWSTYYLIKCILVSGKPGSYQYMLS